MGIHYQGCKNEDKPYRFGATTGNLFPKEMEGYLDADLLASHGLTKERMVNVDALFFYQRLLPICDPRKSDIVDDTRIPYYTECEKFNNLYKLQSGVGGSYGHSWKFALASELVKFDGILIRDGLLGGSRGALFCR